MADGAHPIFVRIGGADAARTCGQVGNSQGYQARRAVRSTAQSIRVTIATHVGHSDMLPACDGGLISGDGNRFNWNIILPVKFVPLDRADGI